MFSQKFDFVHGRALLTCFNDHKKVIQSCYDSLAPGGWCEWQDLILPLHHIGPQREGDGLMKCIELMAEAASKIGRTWNNVQNYKRFFEEVGFENVVERKFYWPAGNWAAGDYYKSLAAYCTQDFKQGMVPIAAKLLPILGMGKEEIDALVDKSMKDLDDPSVHAYTPV